MTYRTLLAFTAAALLLAGPALAGPNCKKCPNKDKSADEGVFEVKEGEGSAEGAEKRKGERAERGERSKRGERRSPMAELGLSEDQQAQAKEIFTASKEKAKAIMVAAKEARENGEEVDRDSIREQMMALRKEAMEKVYNTVLNDDQKAKVDERRKKMEERRAEREAERGERGEREGKRKSRDGERPERSKKGGDDLDL